MPARKSLGWAEPGATVTVGEVTLANEPIAVEGTFSADPPVGQATEAKQDVGNTSLATLAGTVRAEDAAHSSGQSGFVILAVRQDTAASLAGTDGDYIPLIVDANGRLHVSLASLPTLPAGDNNIGNVDIATLPALPAGDNNIGNVDIVSLPTLPAGTNNIGDVDIASIAAGDNNIGNVDVVSLPSLPSGTNNIGDVDVLSVVPGTGATSLGKAEDAVHANGDVGVMSLGVRRDTPTSLVGATGDYIPYTTDSSGRVWVALSSLPTLPAGDNNIGNVDIDTVAVATSHFSGQRNVTTAGTAVALTTTQALKNGVTVKAKHENTGMIYVGASNVTSSNGFVLDAGEAHFISIDDLAEVYIDASVSGEGVSYSAS